MIQVKTYLIGIKYELGTYGVGLGVSEPEGERCWLYQLFLLNTNVSEDVSVIKEYQSACPLQLCEAHVLDVGARWNTGNPVIHPHLHLR